MIVVFRSVASLQIGTGHVIRRLTLADALRDAGAPVHFICRNHPGNLIGRIESQGYTVHVLDARYESDIATQQQKLAHADWLGVPHELDAEECRVVLEQLRPEWLIIDHYAIDEIWESLLRDTVQKVMVVDDLADRHHQCDVLLDQTFGREATDYKELVPGNCRLLFGSQFALLRPEFSQWPEYSLKRRFTPEFKKLLITMGGVDADNVTGQILEALKGCDLPQEVEITVVMGSTTAPHLTSVAEVAASMPQRCDVLINVANMAEIMTNSDLAVGAAGATTWERCCLGLPSILIVLADNQRYIANKLGQMGTSETMLSSEMNHLCESIFAIERELKTYSEKSANVTDRQGISRVIKILETVS